MRNKSLPIGIRHSSPPTRHSSLRPRREPVEPRTARDWLLTLLTALLLPALVVPVFVVAAGEPALSVRGTVQPAAVIEVVGRRFGEVATVDLTWDGLAVSWLPSIQTDAQGRFTLTTSLPTSAALGAHELTAVRRRDADAQSRERRASIVVEVLAAPADVPSAAPTDAPGIAPTAVPIAAPTASPISAPSVTSSVASPFAIVGYGAGTTGGSGGRVYGVSTWAELKSALLASGPRIVRLTGSADFDGGGEKLRVKNGNLTIDGSGWTGTLRRYSLVIAASNVIVTQLRLRPGDQILNVGDGDGLEINPGIGGSLSHIVIDHSSLLWAPDVVLSILNNSWDVTVQYSILGAGLYQSANPTRPNGYGPNVTTIGANPNPGTEYTRRITFYRNYLPHNWGRNIRPQGTDGIDYVNNVVYNWGDQLARLNPRGANVVGNMFKRGPNTTATNVQSQTCRSYPKLFTNSVYWADNLGLGFTPTLDFGAGVQRSGPYGGGLRNVSAAAASSALAASVVAAAGPTLVDSVDQRLKNDFSSGSGNFYNGTGYPAPNPTWQ